MHRVMVHFVPFGSLISEIPELLLDIVVKSVQVLFDRVFALRWGLQYNQYGYNLKQLGGTNYLELHLGQSEYDVTRRILDLGKSEVA